MRIFSIVGARPQFVKLAMMARAVAARNGNGGVRHQIIHTGQHYDAGMNEVFFSDLAIPQPDYHLGVGSRPHGEQTGEMMKRMEPVLARERPDWLLLYGDTNSTLAGGLVGAKLNIRMAHVESGLRSFNRAMPEEINRVVTDHVSELLFCPTRTAVENLQREGLGARTVLAGDVMYDAVLASRKVAEERGAESARMWRRGEFALATVHRAENTDNPDRLCTIMRALERVAGEICPVILPLHPRTKKLLSTLGWTPQRVHVLPPASYLEMLLLEARARFILTDSGGVQKEAYFLCVPCITLRDETEWVETLENRCNALVGASEARILAAAAAADFAGPWNARYGDGNAAAVMVEALWSR